MRSCLLSCEGKMKSVPVCSLLFCVTLFPAFRSGSKILMISTPVYSLCSLISSIGHEMLDRGHHVSIFLPDYFMEHHCYNESVNYRQIQLLEYRTISQPGDMAELMRATSMSLEATRPPTVFDTIQRLVAGAYFECEDIFADKGALQRLHEEMFDFAVISGTMTPVPVCSLVFWMTLFPVFSSGSNILLIPLPGYSLCSEISTIGQELLSRGHHVSIFLPDYFKDHRCYNKSVNNRQIQLLEYMTIDQAGHMAEFMQAISMSLGDKSPPTVFDAIQLLTTQAYMECEDIFADKGALQRLHEEQFDFAIISGYACDYCFVAIPYKLGIPYATVGSFHEDLMTGNLFLPSISPDAVTTYTGDMNFLQRIGNTAVQLYARLVYRLSFPIHTLSDFAPELSVGDIEHLISQSDLFLQNTDTALGYPLPKMPNHIFVGGLTTRPIERDLPAELQKFYASAPNGVIIVSFGSLFTELPESVEQNVNEALQRLDAKVLWKYGDNKIIGNVKRVTWFPQNDLLGNPNTRLFVSHCGNNGLFEALYHSVPIVCTPMFLDQFFNAARVETWEVGRQTNLRAASGEELFRVIKETLNNVTIRANMARASEIYRSQSMHPRQRAPSG